MRSHLQLSRSPALWYAVLGAPVVWLTELFTIYLMVPWACRNDSSIALYAINILALVLAAGSGVIAYLIWARLGSELPGEHGTRTDRTRLMAVIGLMGSGLFTLILIGQLFATAILGPCVPLPRDPKITPDALRDSPAARAAEASA